MKKHYFLLLELLIGCLLLTLAVVPVLRLYTAGYLHTLEAVRFHKQAHLIHQLYAEVTEKLYLQQIPWEEFFIAERRPIFSLESVSQLQKLGFTVSYLFRELDRKKSNEKWAYIFEIEFFVEDTKNSMPPTTYRYPFYLDQGLRI